MEEKLELDSSPEWLWALRRLGAREAVAMWAALATAKRGLEKMASQALADSAGEVFWRWGVDSPDEALWFARACSELSVKSGRTAAMPGMAFLGASARRLGCLPFDACVEEASPSDGMPGEVLIETLGASRWPAAPVALTPEASGALAAFEAAALNARWERPDAPFGHWIGLELFERLRPFEGALGFLSRSEVDWEAFGARALAAMELRELGGVAGAGSAGRRFAL